MKLKGLLIAATVMLVTSATYASIVVRFPSIKTADMCSNMAGQWVGGGTVTAGFIKCHYSGTANVTAISADKFNMDVILHKDSGICPNEEKLQLPGTCENGEIRLQTDDANLHGSVNEQGTAVDLAGTVNFTVLGSRVTADVSDMHLNKQ